MTSRRRRLDALAFAIGLALTPLTASAAEEIDCAVDAVDGETARLWAKGEWRDLMEGADIPRDAIVVTGPETRAKITCSDGLVLTVGVATEINLESLAGQRTGRVTQLVRGILGVLSPRRLREEFIVRTPVATASVGASDALVEFAPGTGAAVFVRDGAAVTVDHDGGSVDLGAGEGVSIDAAGVAGPVRIWGAARIETATDALGFDWRDG